MLMIKDHVFRVTRINKVGDRFLVFVRGIEGPVGMMFVLRELGEGKLIYELACVDKAERFVEEGK